ncbi:MAG: SMC-Scp complex subunit ScpB [Oscillospiraceae bacterium]|nr:SMC-Scp complex subunit ScpB [Oscillospiraceae bacterium]
MRENVNYTAELEAILFAAGNPVAISKLCELLGIGKPACRQQLSLLKEMYNSDRHGIMLIELNDNYQLATKPVFADIVRQSVVSVREMPLSPAAFEVLSVIAYNQPVTKGFIENVRGVDSSQIVNNLVDKQLVEEAGRMNVPGRPIQYKTTLTFLRSFGLSNLDQLPPLPGPDADGQISFEVLT